MSFLSFLPLIFNWSKDNFKWIAIALLAIIIAFGAWRYTNLVKNYANAQYVIEQQENLLKDKEKQLQQERDLAKMREAALEQQAKDLAELEAKLDNITDNLGQDAGDLAPGAIREILKRLGELN